MAFWWVMGAALVFLAWLLAEPSGRRWWRARLARQPFPAPWRKILRRRDTDPGELRGWPF